jgi:diadenosine tetraphosphate (Ap4A) HIT family hydrolase
MTRHFRTQATHDAYEAVKAAGGLTNGCRLCEAQTLQDFSHWRVIPNMFPYDAVATKHTMLIPKRHVTEVELNDAEKTELLELKASEHFVGYNYLFESLHSTRSIPDHYHLHLLKVKDAV